MLVDLRSINLTGKAAEKMLDEVGVTCNKNTIPFDRRHLLCRYGAQTWYTSSNITRDMKEEDMEEIAEIISMTLKDFETNKEGLQNE